MNKDIATVFVQIDEIIDDLSHRHGSSLQDDRDRLISYANYLSSELTQAEYDYEIEDEKIKHRYSAGVIKRLSESTKVTKAEHEIRGSKKYLDEKLDLCFKSLNVNKLKYKYQIINLKLNSLASAIRRAEDEEKKTTNI